MPSPKKIYGLIGYPVKHSLSALMHNAAFEALKIPAEYRLFEIEPSKLEGFLLGEIKVRDTLGEEVESAEVAGFNITIPHKVNAAGILEKKFPLSFGKLTEEDRYYVKLSGAVNTVKREDGQSLYYNTDVYGFRKSLNQDLGFEPKDKKVLILGCGGAGRAVIAGLSWKGLCQKIYIYENNNAAVKSAQEHFFMGDLSREWSDLLRQKLQFVAQKEEIGEVIHNCDLLVNATPVGMRDGDASLIDAALLRENLYVYDVVYNRETELIRDAKKAKCRGAADGLGMLLYQGAAAFELWTGRNAPVDLMRVKLEEGASKL